LRERKDDIRDLAEYFINNFCKKHGKTIDRINNSTIRKIVRYTWPGNIRELKNAIERAVITARDNHFDVIIPESKEIDFQDIKPYNEFKRDYFIRVLEEVNWKVSGKNSASELLQINENTFRSKLKRLNIKFKKTTC
jgi:chemotaxis protein methyltransferase CheR